MITKLPPVNESIPSAINGFQNVQPLVYDNAISPYETISKLLWYVKYLVNKCNEIIDELNKIEGNITDIRNEIEGIKTRLETIESDIEQIKTRLDNHDKKFEELDEEIENITNDINSINTEITNIKNRLDEHDQRLNEIDEQLYEIDVTLKDLQKQITSNDNDITKINEQITEINSNISIINSNIDNLQSQITSNDSDIAALQGRVTTLENDLNALETTVEENRADLQQQITDNKEAHDNAIKALQNRATTLETDVAQLKVDVTNLKTQQAATDRNISIIQNSLNTINNNISSINDNIEVINTTIDNMQNDIETNANNIQNNKNNIAQNTADINELKSQLETFDLTDTKADVEKLKTDVTDLQNKDTEIDNSISGINDEIDSLKQTDTALHNSINSMQSNITSNTNAIQENDKNIDELTEKLNKLSLRAPSISQDFVKNQIIKIEPSREAHSEGNERIVTITAGHSYVQLYIFPISTPNYSDVILCTYDLNKIDNLFEIYKNPSNYTIYLIVNSNSYITVHGKAEIINEDIDTIKSYNKIKDLQTIKNIDTLKSKVYAVNNQLALKFTQFSDTYTSRTATVFQSSSDNTNILIVNSDSTKALVVTRTNIKDISTHFTGKQNIETGDIYLIFKQSHGMIVTGECELVNQSTIPETAVDLPITTQNIVNIDEPKGQQALTELEGVDDRLSSLEDWHTQIDEWKTDLNKRVMTGLYIQQQDFSEITNNNHLIHLLNFQTRGFDIREEGVNIEILIVLNNDNIYYLKLTFIDTINSILIIDYKKSAEYSGDVSLYYDTGSGVGISYDIAFRPSQFVGSSSIRYVSAKYELSNSYGEYNETLRTNLSFEISDVEASSDNYKAISRLMY